MSFPVAKPLTCDPETLARLVREGDVAALDRLSRCYAGRLLAVGRRWCASEADAEDAVQDALVAAGEHLGDYRGEGAVEGWLSTMVVNACRRMRRGQKNDPSRHVAVEDGVLEARGASPEEAAASGEIATALGEALAELSAEDRAIFLLAEAAGWTAPEIAARVGRSPGAVRTRLTRLRARLREKMQARL